MTITFVLGGSLQATVNWSGVATDSASHFVAVASGTNQSATSSNNGTTFAAGGSLPSSASWSALATDKLGKWIAVASGGTATAISSNNGVTWSAGGALPSSTTWQALVTDGKGNWVAIAKSGATAISSNNGVTWTAGGSLPAGTWQSLATDNGGNWVAIANGSTATAVSTNNGASWSSGGALPSSTAWQAIATDTKGHWVVVANSSTATAVSTNNGASWGAGGAAPSAAVWTSLATDTGGNWVAVSNGTAVMISTNNGTTWTAAPNAPRPGTDNWSALTSDGHGNWVAVGGTADFRSIVACFGPTGWVHTGTNGSGANTVAIVPAAGELLLCAFMRTMNTTPDTTHTVTDNGSGGWTRIGPFESNGNTACTGWYKIATALDHNGGTGITVTGAGNGTGGVSLQAIGVDRFTAPGVITIDMSGGNHGATSNLVITASAGSSQPTNRDELAWVCVGGNLNLGGLNQTTFRGTSSSNVLTQGINQVGLASAYGSPNQGNATAANNTWNIVTGSLRNEAGVGVTFYYPTTPAGSGMLRNSLQGTNF